MATKLGLFNNALLAIGELNLSSLSENREPRRVLDQVYDNGFVNRILEIAPWKFATRSVKLEIDPSVTPSFGYANAFQKPSDFVLICKVCQEEFYNYPLLRYNDEGNYLFSDLDEIFIQYVSNGVTFGNNLAVWPESFTHYAELNLAVRISKRLVHNASELEILKKDLAKALTRAKSIDAMKNPTTFMPNGSFVDARRGAGRGGGGRQDGGGRGSFLG